MNVGASVYVIFFPDGKGSSSTPVTAKMSEYSLKLYRLPLLKSIQWQCLILLSHQKWSLVLFNLFPAAVKHKASFKN